MEETLKETIKRVLKNETIRREKESRKGKGGRKLVEWRWKGEERVLRVMKGRNGKKGKTEQGKRKLRRNRRE